MKVSTGLLVKISTGRLAQVPIGRLAKASTGRLVKVSTGRLVEGLDLSTWQWLDRATHGFSVSSTGRPTGAPYKWI
jgi:hypothetical protein